MNIKQKAYQLFLEKNSYRKIAKKLNISSSTAHGYVDEIKTYYAASPPENDELDSEFIIVQNTADENIIEEKQEEKKVEEVPLTQKQINQKKFAEMVSNYFNSTKEVPAKSTSSSIGQSNSSNKPFKIHPVVKVVAVGYGHH